MSKTYRCSACGCITPVIQFRGDIERVPAACSDHPEAEVIEWPMRMQAALIYLTRIGPTMTPEDLATICDHHRDMTAGLVLYERWGHQLPEYGAPTREPSPQGLFG